jgi:hypothetical protein
VRAEEFVEEVAVAVFHVDEREAQVASAARGRGEILDDALDLAVGQHGVVALDSDAAVEDGMSVRDFRLGRVGALRSREPS